MSFISGSDGCVQPHYSSQRKPGESVTRVFLHSWGFTGSAWPDPSNGFPIKWRRTYQNSHINTSASQRCWNMAMPFTPRTTFNFLYPVGRPPRFCGRRESTWPTGRALTGSNRGIEPASNSFSCPGRRTDESSCYTAFQMREPIPCESPFAGRANLRTCWA